ncbi:TonB-dependent receptor domain-containing protein [Nitrospina watsonii]|uniref:TonB-dependent siderophore receptor n=1 Tax=Nitrospina watsonii TaxID=1323948 RepID=A0ABM9HAD4_9BACT|nr:TonB-dependent receptor [Nitrospina watsonii]CAI2717107.1 TonB-dependent siderophore receptor [Nitrospina watsonii]
MLWTTLSPDESKTHSFKHRRGAWVPGMLAVCLLTLAPVQAGALDAETDVHTISAEMETPGDGLLVAQAGPARSFRIPPQDLQSALVEFSRQSGIQILYQSDLVKGIQTQGVSGDHAPEEALKKLLSGTDLTYTFADGKTVTVKQTSADKEGKLLPPVVVSATRGIGTLVDSPQGVTIVTKEQIEKQTALTTDLGDILAKTVPGLGTSTEGNTEVGQTLRGQNLQVFIDGVPQTIQLRNGQRNLRTIDPSAIERIEVLRGSTSVYGLGGTGGVINIITKSPGEGPVKFSTDVTVGFQPVDVGESLRKRLIQRVEGGKGKFDYILSATGEQTGGFFDGDGDRIPPDPNGQGGIADSDSYNLFGKLGYDPDDRQRFEFSTNFFKLQQDTDFIRQGGITGVQKTTAVPGDPGGKKMGTENLQVNLNYRNKDVMGSLVKAQLYYRDYWTRFGLFTSGQSFIDSQRYGGRLDVETPVSSFGRLLWGVDVLYEESSQPFEDGTFFTPEMEQWTVGPFAQAEVVLFEDLTLHGGVRYEKILFSVDDFTTVSGSDVVGGDLDYGRAVFNAGLTYALDPALSVFASFSQGFTVPEIGRVLRTISTAGNSVENIRPEAQVVDNYEVGVRGNWSKVQGEVSLFYSESDFGTSLTSPTSPTALIGILRIPERVYGIEASFDTQPFDRWEVGGTLTWMEGELDSDSNGNFDSHMLGNRIPPLKVTGYVENQTLPDWRNRLQMLYSGNRDRFHGQTGFGKGTVSDFVLVDALSTFAFKTGSLSVGIRNLLDEQYFPTISQFYNLGGNRFSAGSGRTISATYSFKW